MEYTIKKGEELLDVCMNLTGFLSNYESIIEANELDTWTPNLLHGTVITIPDTLNIQTNITNNLVNYPFCNNFVINNLFGQITDLIDDLIAPNKLFENDDLFVFSDSDQYRFNLEYNIE